MKTRETPVLEARDLLVVRGGTTILDVPEFSLAAGEVVAVIGPNGAGKTTMLSAVLGLRQTSGEGMVARGGLRFPGTPPHLYRRGFSMVFQDSLLFNTTVYENVASGLRIRGVSRREIGRIVTEQLERFGVAALSGRKATRFPEGRRSASASPGPSRPLPRSCCSTNPSPRSIRQRASPSSTISRRPYPARVPRCCSSPMTASRRCASRIP